MKKYILLVVLLLTLCACPKVAVNVHTPTQTDYEFDYWQDMRIDGDTAIFYISYSIGAKKFHLALEAMKDRGIKKLHIWVMSGGGSMLDMFDIIDQVDEFKKNGGTVTSHIAGFAGSAALPIYLMGDHRTIGTYSSIMLHPHSLWNKTLSDYIWGMDKDEVTPTDETLFHKMSLIWTYNYAWIVSERTNLSFLEAWNLVSIEDSDKGQYWFTAMEALNMGFAHEII